jgi:hypothetical protein
MKQHDVSSCLAGLPGALRIGAYDWTIKLEEGSGDFCGLADFAIQHLYLWPDNLNSPSHAVGIFLHECLHVIFMNQGLEQLKRGREDREEQIVMGFEAGLTSLFRDNPKLLTWMKKWLA